MKIDLNINKQGKLDQSIPIFSPRTRFKNIRQIDQALLADLTLNFDQFTINILKQEFKKNDQKMTLVQFISVVTQHLNTWQTDLSNRSVKLIRCLTNLFFQIDLNDNKLLEWNQFTNYIIQKATVIKNNRNKIAEIKTYSKSNIKPKQKFKALISKAIYITDQDRIAFFEEGKDKIYFLNPYTGDLDKKSLIIIPKQIIVKMTGPKKQNKQKKDFIIKSKTEILDILYLSDEKYKVLLTSSSDKYIRGWRMGTNDYILASQPDNEEELIQHKFPSQIYKMAWDGLNQYIYCGLKNGGIIIWNLKTDTQRQLPTGIHVSSLQENKIEQFEQKKFKKQNFQGHSMQINDMIAMPKLQFMASASMDKKLILWDTINYKIKRVYTEHNRGILSLAFNQSLILLFSAGFDHQICIWNPYIKNIIHKIQYHTSPILSIQVIEGTNQVISLDEDGIVNIIDSESFQLISSFSIQHSFQKHRFNAMSFTYTKKPLKLFFTGRTIYVYEYDKNYNPNYIDDSTALCCRFVSSMLCFFTPCGNKVKIWNALSGNLYKIYSNITNADITAFQLDFREKRMIIGNFLGFTHLYNIRNGARLKSLPKHHGQVIAILNAIVNSNIDLFITGAIDNRIIISKDDIFGEAVPLRQLEISKDVLLTTMCFCQQSKSIIVGTTGGIIGYYQSDTGKLLPNTNQKQLSQDILCLKLLGDLPFVISCNPFGKINLIAIPPLQFKFAVIYSWIHEDIQDQKNICIGVSHCLFSMKRKWFYTSSDKGYIKCYDLSNLYTALIKYKQPQKLKIEISEKYFKKTLQMPKITHLTIKMLWYIKAHNQIIKSIDHIEDEDLLISTSFDKKVKIWNLQNGNPIDQIQQNYQKQHPKPIAYKKINKDQIVLPNMIDRVDKIMHNQDLFPKQELSKRQKTLEEQFNPFYFEQKFSNKNIVPRISNHQWNIFLNVGKYYEQYQKLFNNIMREFQINVIKKRKKTLMPSSDEKKIYKLKLQRQNIQIFQSVKSQPKKNKEIRNSKGQLVYLKPSEMKIFQLKMQLLNLQKQIPKSKQKKKKDHQKHMQYINYLHNRQLEGTLMFRNNQKVYLSENILKKMYSLTEKLALASKNDYKSIKMINNLKLLTKK